MRVHVTQKPFVAELAVIRSVIKSPSQPLQFLAKDGRLEIVAEQPLKAVATSLDALVGEPGKVTITAKPFLDLVLLLDSEISLEVIDQRLVVTSGEFTASLLTVIASNNWEEPELSGRATMPAQQLASVLSTIEHAARMSAYISSVQLEFGAGGIRGISTDGHRMVVAERDKPGEAEAIVQLPISLMGDVKQLLGKRKDDALVEFNDRGDLRFTTGPRRLCARQPAATFPAYKRVMPTTQNLTGVVNRDELKAAVKRTNAFDKTGNTDLVFESKVLTVVGVAGRETLPWLEFTGPAVVNGMVRMQSAYLDDALAAVQSPRVLLHVIEPFRPFRLSSTGEGFSDQFVIMPINK